LIEFVVVQRQTMDSLQRNPLRLLHKQNSK